MIVLTVEGVPQLLMLSMVMTHWHGDFNMAALTFFVSFADIPLIVWYLSFYCEQRTKFVIIGKIINLAIRNSTQHWASFVEWYIYDEKEIVQMENLAEADNINNTDNGKGYHSSKPWIVLYYQLGYIVVSPILGKFKAKIII